MSGYTKLFGSLVHSTIWRESDHVRIVWITMLALSDRDGIVEASVPGLADAARVSLEQCEESLSKLASPDKYSRSKAHEGRRIREVDGGWELLNHDVYRARASKDEAKEKAASRVRRFREKNGKCNADVTPCNATKRTVTPCSKSNAIAEADPEADPEAGDPPYPPPTKTNQSINDSDRDTLCPTGLALPHEARSALAKRLGVSVPDIDAATEEFVTYWVVGGGTGRRHNRWIRKLRQDIHEKHKRGKLAGLGSSRTDVEECDL